MKIWLKWFILCTLATFPYNLYGFAILYLSNPLQKFGYLATTLQKFGFFVGGLFLFSLFITAFYWLDSWLIRHGYTNLTQAFLQVIGLKFLIILIGVLLLYTIQSIMTLFLAFPEAWLFVFLYEWLRLNAREMAQLLIANPDWYNLLKVLIAVPIFLVIETVCLLIGISCLEVGKYILKN